MSGPGGVGFFGKLPGVGDFVQRRLPPAFVTAWDGGFESAVNGARAEFGGDWDALWRAAPIWRFALPRGVCGESAWVGVTGPSVDRVGRRFPMVLAHAVESVDAVTGIVRSAQGWFAALEQVCAAACTGATATDDFDAAVSALADPFAWLDNAARAALPGGDFDGRLVAWHQAGDDRQLDAAWSACRAVEAGCLWWTCGRAGFASSLCMTRGLPHPDVYAGFLATAQVAMPTGVPLRMPEPGITQVSAPAMADDDVFGDLLHGFGGEAVPMAAEAAPASMPALSAVENIATVETVVAAPVRAHGPVCVQQDAVTLVAADNGADDPRRQATAQVAAALADGVWSDAAVARERLLGLHPALRACHEDLIDPVPEDCAVAAAWLQDGRAVVLRIGAAMAWHSRHGQLRPLFADAGPAADEVDTVRPDDLVGAPATVAPRLPGLGATADPLCEEATCEVESGDRLILLATDTLVRVPAAKLAASLAGASAAESSNRIAASAGLDMDRAQWPMAVIEVGT